MTLRQLIIKLPPMPMEEDFGETELCSRFVEAFLCGLFGDPDNDTYLRWKNESTLEARSMPFRKDHFIVRWVKYAYTLLSSIKQSSHIKIDRET
ncbi:hypothetical protein HMPREF1544_00725 [Mucor circinelloides 1006PhL]|uniref:Uncharacterized protein n=1 Tax=Mucor circinelloides f. circinelloides (strain 1006PhL) TaxID=1220926 RepID=S2JVJ0_MUCC1|nr:hypothetical protein HMPREF1544_00725 [Mucor circinelloides 1006PhL]